ncbi:VCBS repeat-containing protein [Streptomyces sp. NPDC006482]|uniref:FG-GAP repeat domain-containing protein n=1 Tax=Streptomyces sp. NPDC006482 TaxID=3154306 RepID=UPI0033B27A7F
MRKILGAGIAAALLVTGGVVGAGTAVAAGDPTFEFSPVENKVLMPGEGWTGLAPPSTTGQNSGEPDGTYVYALSKKPLLTGSTWSGGLPAGLKVDRADGCTLKAGLAGVYLCDLRGWGNPAPDISATSTAVNGLTAYYSLVYVPRGASIDAGVKEAQTAASQPIGTRRAHATITVKTRAHVAQNTLTMSTPTLPAGGSVKHTVKLHAVDKGRLTMALGEAPGYRGWDENELKVSIVSADTGGAAGAVCDHSTGYIGWGGGGIHCDVTQPGDYTVTYGLSAAANAPAWRVRNLATYEVFTFGTGNPEKASDFAIGSSVPVIERHRLLGRDAEGWLWDYRGTGKASPVLNSPDPVGGSFDWNQYSAVTRLGPVTVQSTGPGAVARDRSGVLWFYRMSGDGGIYTETRLRLGAGWNIYNAIVGGSDLTGDKKADLLARDTAGVLWMYPGTGNTTTPLGNRVRLGAGWGIYNSLVGGTDVTGDGKADLVARDTAGKQWLYAGTGAATRPLGGRTQVGYGWQGYNSMVAPGDLNGDRKADLVARDSSGTLWFYAGTGVASKPYAARVKVGAGWQRYNLLF